MHRLIENIEENDDGHKELLKLMLEQKKIDVRATNIVSRDCFVKTTFLEKLMKCTEDPNGFRCNILQRPKSPSTLQ